MSMRIGCDNLVYAIMTTEDTVSSAPVYAAIQQAPGVMHVNINPNTSLTTAFFDDGPGDTAATLGNIEVEIQKNTLTAANKADLLGHVTDGNGGTVYGGEDNPPWVAVGFRSLKSNGKYRYVWLYKGRFSDPEDNNDTKDDSIKFQSDTIKGRFVKLAYPITINSVSKRLWKYEIDSDTPNASTVAMTNWFTAVAMPIAAANPAPVNTVAYTAGTVTGTTKATITGSATGHFAYKLTATPSSIPNVGDYIPGLTTYVSAANLAAQAGMYLAIYDADVTDHATKFTSHLIVSGEIM